MTEDWEEMRIRVGLSRIRKKLRKLNRSYQARRSARALSKNAVVVNSAGRKLVVLPDDQRAWVLHSRGGAVNPFISSVWKLLVASFEPDTVVDIGANYGDITLSAEYPTSTQLYLIEPNPSLSCCLEETIVLNGLGGQATVLQVAAGTEDGEVDLYIDTQWSGMSRIMSESPRRAFQVCRVPLRRIESLVSPGRRVLVKVDVEGQEAAAIRGAKGILDSADDYAILCEISHMDTAAINWLIQIFSPFVIGRGGRVLPVQQAADIEDISREGRHRKSIHPADIILAKRGGLRDQLWRQMTRIVPNGVSEGGINER